MSSPIAPTDNDLDTIFTPPSCEQWQDSALAGVSVDSALDDGSAAVFAPGTLISKTTLTLPATLLASLGHPPLPTSTDS